MTYFNQSQIEIINDQAEKLAEYIDQELDFYLEDEGYKYKAVSTFKREFDLEADDLEEMLVRATKDSKNLLASGQYYPLTMLTRYANRDPEFIREELKKLLTGDDKPVGKRIDEFKEKVESKLKKPDEKTFFDPRFFSFLLAAYDPIKYFYVKTTQFRDFSKLVGEELSLSRDLSCGDRYEKMVEIANRVREVIKNNQLFIEAHRKVVDHFDYKDESLSWGTWDFIFNATRKDNADSVPVQYWTYTPGEGAEKWEDFYNEGIMAIGWDELGDLEQYNDKEEIRKELKRSYKTDTNANNNAVACYDFSKVMKEGDFVIVKKKSRELVGLGKVTSGYFHDDSREEYRNVRKVDWIKKGSWQIDQDTIHPAPKTLTNITSYEGYPEKLMGIINGNKIMTEQKSPKNLILYGPPGTGKTYMAMKKAEELLSGQVQKETREEKIAELLNDLKWREAVGLVMTQKDEGVRVPELNKEELMEIYSGYCQRSSKPQNTIWGVLQSNSTPESSQSSYRNDRNLFYKDENSKWFLTEDGKELFETEEYQNILSEVQDPHLKEKDWKDYYRFVTFHQSYSYEEFVEGIRPALSENDSSELQYEIKDGIFKQVCEKAKNDPENKYLLIIDEINRGNISKIFGELITLLEENKRADKEEEIRVILPYSREVFSVPDNLYLLGTMNTADRSIALLDVALRRRFEFKELMPDDRAINSKIEELDLAKLMNNLNQKIKIMINRDHQLGHSYFRDIHNTKDLQNVWYEKLIPLLQEYFYNDWQKIEQLLGRYKADDGVGFVEYIDNGVVNNLFHDGEAEDYLDFIPGEIHRYSEEKLVRALKNIYER